MSRIRIFPPVIEVFPNDRQEFFAEATPTPPLWAGGVNAHILEDSALIIDALASSMSSAGGHRLFSGIGVIQFTIDDFHLPTSTGKFAFTGFINDVNGFQYIYTVEITATAVNVVIETLATIYTESYSTVSGDVYRLELNAGFRLYRNGVLLNSRVSLPTVVTYPMSYAVVLLEPVDTDPGTIPPPRLVGDWRLAPVATWTAPSHGSIITTGPSLFTEYFGGTTPGQYTLSAQVDPAADGVFVQLATATIEIPTLQIVGSNEIDLEPSQQIRLKTNYDKARSSKLVAWSVVAGPGSFTQDEFTAGSAPGNTVVRATASVNSQVADITITVAAVITNANDYVAAKVSEQIDFDTNLPTMPYFVSAGTMAEGTGAIAPGLPPGLQKDDIMLLFVETASQAVSTPSGWAIVTDSPQETGAAGGATSTRLSVFWKRAVVAEAVPSITDPGDHAIGQILAFRGCISTGNPWDVTSGDTGASSTSVSIPGDTTTVAGCLVVLAVANQTDSATPQTSAFVNADLTNLAELTDVNTASGNGGGFAVAAGGKAAAGAYGATAATLANASVQGRMSIALKPGSITWSASIGSINSSSGVWTAPSLAGQTAIISVTNGTTTALIEVQVLEVFPLDDPILPINWDLDIPTLVGMTEDRSSRFTREKAEAFDAYQLKFASRTLTEAETVALFFRSHGYGKLFILDDALRGIRRVGWFDSAIRFEGADECAIDMAFRFLEAKL